MTRKRLLFVSPRFLFPVDSGGKIRTTQMLRGLKGHAFDITLLCPASDEQRRIHAADIASVCDRLASWKAEHVPRLKLLQRVAAAFSSLPIPVATDRSARGRRLVDEELALSPDVVVFDFAHSAVLAPNNLRVPSVLFTHNIEAEIFKRHAEVNKGPLALLWRNQLQKMLRFERDALARFDAVIAVSARDAEAFERDYGTRNVHTIGTGVDLDYFSYAPPADGGRVVFTGSMDWLANRDGIEFLLDSAWPLLLKQQPSASMCVVGRDPPQGLIRKAAQAGFDWAFTGFVDDVRPYVRDSSIYVVPLRVGGGTRLKVYEAMAMGCPVISTAIGVEGLPLIPGEHYLLANDEMQLANTMSRLLADGALRAKLSTAARRFVEDHCSFRAVARQFEQICQSVLPEDVGSAQDLRSSARSAAKP
jgi:glycosyltransferase involved in cell wall biosynthesis